MKPSTRDYDQWEIMKDLRSEFRVVAAPDEQDRLPMIPLKEGRGSIHVHGRDTLGAFYRHRYMRKFARKLKNDFPAVEILEGDGEAIIIWPKSASWSTAMMDQLGAKRRMQLSDEERESRRRRGIKFRGNLRQKTARQALESTISPRKDLSDVGS